MTSDPLNSSQARASEYLDSPRMTQRLVYRRWLSARIEGNYGVYRTTVPLTKKGAATCTCPSDYWPCKHVYAVRATWAANPDSFFDFAVWLAEFSDKPASDLIDALREVLWACPEGLGVLGVAGFDAVSNAEEDE